MPSPAEDPGDFRRQVIGVLRRLGPGEVVSYGDVAAEAGYPGAARAVGSLLADEASDDVPWWRVVTSTGRLVPGHEERHARLLRKEGVKLVNGRVHLDRRTTPRP
jgi:methylated-DNA-protein-cysteine methyltransferase-like protein